MSYRCWVRIGVMLIALSVLAASAAEFGPKPKLDLTVRSFPNAQDPSVVLEVVYSAGELRSTGVQFDIEVSDASNVTVSAGPAAEFANKTLAVADTDKNHKRVLAFGLNADLIWDGVLAVISITPGEAEAQDPVIVRLTSVVAVDQGVAAVALDTVRFKGQALLPGLGRQISAIRPLSQPIYATVPCSSDVNGDGKVDVADLQCLAAMAAGATHERCDLDVDGRLNSADFQVVLRTILNLALTPPSQTIGASQ